MNRRKMKQWKQLIAAMLAITLLATSADLQLLAAPAEETATEESRVDDETVEKPEAAGPKESFALSGDDPQILSEVEEKREESSKTFLMSDGTFMVAQYAAPVHYEDAEGGWQEIDHSLELETTETAEVYTTTEKAGDRDRIKFSKKLKEGKTVAIKNTEFPLSWGIKGAEKQTVQVEAAEAKEPKSWNNKFLIADTNSQILRYADIIEGVDAEYRIQSSGIKENIILKEKDTPRVFEIVYDIGKLTPIQEDEHTIYLKNGEEIIYQIRAPYMQDAGGVMSDAITLSMETTKNHEITVTMTADEDWLTEEGRIYPVVLDPAVVTKTKKAAIDSTFVTSGKPSTNHSDKFELLVGRESSEYEYCRTLMKVDLPELEPGDMVVNAQMLMIMYHAEFYSTETPALQMNVHQITREWEYDTVTWNNRPTFDSTVLDYAYVKQDDIKNMRYEKYFDITEAVKNWYDGTAANYGIEVKSADESGSYAENGVKGYFWPERYNSVDEQYPRYVITYRNNKGLEDYWSYTTLSAGTAGTAYVNDYTGNLVFVHNDVSTTGELMPVTLQHVYNSYMKNQRFAGSHPSAGRGWKLSVQQTVMSSEEYGLTGESLKAFPYAYEDGDGTVHFFYKKTEDGKTKYLDEDGLGLELKIDGSTKTITDKEKNIMTFGTKGNLTSIADVRGNTITVTYKTAEDGKSQITKVIDGAGHVIKLEEHNTTFYNLKTITDPSGRTTTYTYVIYDDASGNRAVSKIEYPDGTSSRYTYDSSGALLTAASSDGSGLKFTYTTAKKGKRISKVVEFGTDGSDGQTITFDRSKYNTTVIRTAGSDDVFDNEDDLLTTYRFDNFGRTIASNTKTFDGSAYYGGDSQSYTAGAVNDDGSNIGKLNRVTQSAYSTKAVRNLLKNHSAEKDTNWSTTYWLTSSSEYTASMTTTEKYFGKRSFSITGKKIEENGGGAYYQTLSTDLVRPGNTYTFSGYIKTDEVIKSNTVDYGYGACLAVRLIPAEGNSVRQYSDYITGTTVTGYNNGWRKVSLTFTVPEDTIEVKVYGLLKNATGIAYFDGLQLETGSAAHAYNLLENASFETISSSKPTGWTLGNSSDGDGSSAAHYHNGGNSLKLAGEAGVNKNAYQNVEVSGKESDIYIVSGWAWAEALPDAEDITRSFDVFARVYYSDGESVFKSKQAGFNRDVTGWQRASMAFDLDDGDGKNDKTPTEIRVGVRYNKQENVAYFDSLQLVKDISNSYTYDSEGNIITAKENGDKSSSLNYDDDNNLTSLTDAENNLYKYEYNKYKQVTKATAPLGQTVNYTYTAKGPLNYTIISSPGGDLKIRTGSVYNEESNGISKQAYVVQDWDQNGYKTKYDIDLKSGLTKSVTTPDNEKTSYTYDPENDLLTKVESGNMNISYSYDESKTRLKSISHNGPMSRKSTS